MTRKLMALARVNLSWINRKDIQGGEKVWKPLEISQGKW